MSTKLYVGNLSFSLTEEDIENHFSSVGAVDSVSIITDRDTGRSRGFGFVEMSNSSEANEAIAELNESDLDGRKIIVNEAKPRENRGGGGNRGGYGGGGGRGGHGGGRNRW